MKWVILAIQHNRIIDQISYLIKFSAECVLTKVNMYYTKVCVEVIAKTIDSLLYTCGLHTMAVELFFVFMLSFPD